VESGAISLSPSSARSRVISWTESEDGFLLVITDHDLWRVDRSLHAARLASAEGIQKALVRADGSALLLLPDGWSR
jgi:hypothetical protein